VPAPAPVPAPPPSNSTPAPPPTSAPPAQPIPAPATQQSLLVRNTASGNQAAFYFLSFYYNDPKCAYVSNLYDPVADQRKFGLYSNPVRIDKSQSDCFPVAYGVSLGVIAGTTRYFSYRQFASNDCSGTYQDYVRLIMPSQQQIFTDPSQSCFSFVSPTLPVTQLSFRVSIANPNVNALNYPLPGLGHESMDYDPFLGKFWLGNVYDQNVYAMDPARSAQAARPVSFGGSGYAGVEQFPLNQLLFTGITTNIVSSALAGFGLRSIGECVHVQLCCNLPSHTSPPPQRCQSRLHHLNRQNWSTRNPSSRVVYPRPVSRFQKKRHSLISIWWRLHARFLHGKWSDCKFDSHPGVFQLWNSQTHLACPPCPAPWATADTCILVQLRHEFKHFNLAKRIQP
jgi:hypothetical protein